MKTIKCQNKIEKIIGKNRGKNEKYDRNNEKL
jgi:hypothetical protein